MKSKSILILVMLSILSVILYLFLFQNKSDNKINSRPLEMDNSFITMMIQQDDGSYKQSTSNNWPEGYIIDKMKSGCKNGSELSIDEENQIVYVSAINNDSCYIYFSKGYSLNEYILELYTSDGENNLYYHDGTGEYGTLEAGDNSYRYSGADPNNYICFGSDAEICPHDNLYRIIGLFDDDGDGLYSSKLIKADYIKADMLGVDGNYAGAYSDTSDNYKGSMSISEIAAYQWNDDTSEHANGSNNWETSELNTINLNANYWNYLGSDWQNLIETTTWYLAGHDTSAQKPKFFYDIERNGNPYGSHPKTYTDEIGLIYPSDYGYAATPNYWSTNIGSYTSSRNNNWMYLGLYEWTITPVTSGAYRLYYLNVNGSENGAAANSNYTLRPTFYLKTNVMFYEGDGSRENPFKIVF